MPLWVGEMWQCVVCGWNNAILRIHCRNCGRAKSLEQVKVAPNERDATALDVLMEHLDRHYPLVLTDGQHCRECCGERCGRCLVCTVKSYREGKVPEVVCPCGKGVCHLKDKV